MRSLLIGLLCGALALSSPASAGTPAKALLRQALAAQGGEQSLRAIKSVQWRASGYRNLVEESERPEGPYIAEFDAIREIHDYAGDRYLSASAQSIPPAGSFSSAVIINKGVAMTRRGENGKTAGSALQVKVARESEALSPERLLVTAIDASDAHREADSIMQDVPQNVVAFTLDGAPVRIFLNAYTHLPTAVDYSGPMARTGFWSFLGDVVERTYYGFWRIEKGGVRFPMQWNIESNGLPDRMLEIEKLSIDAPIADADLNIPDDVRAAFKPDAPPLDRNTMPLGISGEPPQELAPGVILIPGQWNATIVRQKDGLVIIEAPIASGYSAKVIAEAKRRFPDLPIKAVISTSDAWPHIAGIREYVAEAIPIYALDLDKPILERIINAPYTSKPDALQRARRAPVFHLISGKTVIGAGDNRLEIYPMRGETSERQLMIYFPKHRLLYGSDAFQRDGKGGYFLPQTVSELLAAAARERLKVDRFYMMHVGPMPWSDLAKVVRDAASSGGDEKH